MDRNLLTSVCNQVYRKFPEVNGVSPKVQSRPDEQTLLIFNGKATTADGRSLPRAVRAVVDKNGKIVKLTTSR